MKHLGALAAGKPFLPLTSSLGDCDQWLPTCFNVDPPPSEGATPSHDGALVVSELLMAIKPEPSIIFFHSWTFRSRLHLQLTYNHGRTSDALLGPYFRHVVDVVTLLGLRDGLYPKL